MASKIFENEFIVAEISDVSGILGMDFLETHNAQVFIAKPEMVLKGYTVKLYKRKRNTYFFVKLKTETVFPLSQS